ncbi:hypothetical protein HDU76_013759 [Blyttiomyces sp. JEL0837]|nr:hypothetical protein HDU76_013759 [Blyttiomyces sp. JEL0837]
MTSILPYFVKLEDIIIHRPLHHQFVDKNQSNLSFTTEIREFIKERSDLEREFSKKLESLSKRYSLKRDKRSSSGPSAMVAGSSSVAAVVAAASISGSNVYDGDSILGDGCCTSAARLSEEKMSVINELSNTVDQAWTSILQDTVNRSKAHSTLADALSTNVCEQLKQLTMAKELARKKHLQFAQKLVTERERVYAEKERAKRIYDDACDIVEADKTRHDRAVDDKTQEKLKRQWHNDILELNNHKNMYILSLDMANAIKNKYFQKDLPELLRDMCDLTETMHEGLKTIWKSYTTHQSNFQTQTTRSLTTCTKIVESIQPSKDIQSFISTHPQILPSQSSFRQQVSVIATNPSTHTLSQSETSSTTTKFPTPRDFPFIPTSLWRDSNFMSQDEFSRVFLLNKVVRLRKKLEQVEKEVAVKVKGIDGMAVLREVYLRNPAQGDPEEVMENMLEVKRDLTLLQSVRVKIAAQVEAIVKHIGDSTLSETRRLQFQQSVITAVPKYGASRKLDFIARIGKRFYLIFAYTSPFKYHSNPIRQKTPNLQKQRFLRPPKMRNENPTNLHRSQKLRNNTVATNKPTAKPSITTIIKHLINKVGAKAYVLYDYVPPDEGCDDEVMVREGDLVVIVDVDDGSGWTLIKTQTEKVGLVPTAYIEIQDSQEDEQDTETPIQSELTSYPNNTLLTTSLTSIPTAREDSTTTLNSQNEPAIEVQQPTQTTAGYQTPQQPQQQTPALRDISDYLQTTLSDIPHTPIPTKDTLKTPSTPVPSAPVYPITSSTSSPEITHTAPTSITTTPTRMKSPPLMDLEPPATQSKSNSNWRLPVPSVEQHLQKLEKDERWMMASGVYEPSYERDHGVEHDQQRGDGGNRQTSMVEWDSSWEKARVLFDYTEIAHDEISVKTTAQDGYGSTTANEKV